MTGPLLHFKYYPWVTHGGFIPIETHMLHVPIPIETHTHAVGMGFYEYGYGYALKHPWVTHAIPYPHNIKKLGNGMDP